MADDPSDIAAFVSLSKAARRIGVSVPTVVRLCERGELPKFRWVSGKRMLGRRALEAWIARQLGEEAA